MCTKDNGTFMGLMIIFLLAFLLGIITGSNGKQNFMRKEAIDNGVAYYAVDKYGKSIFVWGTNVINTVENSN